MSLSGARLSCSAAGCLAATPVYQLLFGVFTWHLICHTD